MPLTYFPPLKDLAGLSNVDNSLQIKRNEPDISTLDEKLLPSDNDYLLIEDSADSFAKKKIRLSSLKNYIKGVL